MPTYSYDVVINASLNAEKVKRGGDDTRQTLTFVEKETVKQQNKLEALQKKHEDKLAQLTAHKNNKIEQITKQNNARIELLAKQHRQKLEDLQQREAAKAFDAKAKELRDEQKLRQQHQNRLEVLEKQHRNRLEQIASRGNTAYKNETSFFGKLSAGWTDVTNAISGVTSAVSNAVQAFDIVFGYARQGAETIFNLTKATSDYGSAIYEASQQTGLSATTISSLKFAADQTNVSMESLVTGVNRFEKTLAEAARGNDKAKESLLRLGIDPQKGINDLQGSLEKAFKVINDAPEGVRQASAATDAFGKTGAALIPIIKQADGDIVGLIKRARELGLVFSDEQAQAADDFGDSLAVVSAQLKAAGYTFGKAFFEPTTQGLKSLSQYFKDNQDSIKNFADSSSFMLAGFAESAVSGFKSIIPAIIALDTQVSLLTGGFINLINTADAFRRFNLWITGIPDPQDRLKAGAAGFDKDKAYQQRLIDDVGQMLYRRQLAGRPSVDDYNISAGGESGGSKKPKQSKEDYIDSLIVYNANRRGIDPDLIRAVIGQESGGRLKAVSNKGAGGLMQLIPGTASRYQVKDRFNAAQNIRGGVNYLADLIAMFDGNIPLALAAYNAGEGAVQKYGNKIPPYAETQKYVPSVLSRYAELKGKGKEGTVLNIGGQNLLVRENTIAELVQRIKGFEDNRRKGIITSSTSSYQDAERSLGSSRDDLTFRGGTNSTAYPIIRTTGQVGTFTGRLKTPEEIFREDRNTAQAQAETALNLRASNIEQEKFLAARSRTLDIENEYFDLEVRLSTLQKEKGDSYLENVRRTNQVTSERISLEEQLLRLGDEMVTGGVNQSLRVQVALMQDVLEMRRREEQALISINRSQLELSQQTEYSAPRATAKVLEFLAAQRSVTDVIADAKINVIQGTYDLIDRGLDKVTRKLGAVGSIIKDLISGFARLALNKFFQAIFGGGGQSGFSIGGQSQGGGFNIGSILSGVLGGGGVFGRTPPFFPTGNFAGGLPITGLGNGLNGSIANSPVFGAFGGLGGFGSNIGTGAAPASLGIGGLIGGIAPFLGLGLGAQLGQGSIGSSILGGAGGLLAGGIATAFLAPSILTSIFGGTIAGVGGATATAGLGGALAGVLTNPFTIALAPLILGAAFFIGRNSRRRKEEGIRNQAMLDAFSQLDSLIEDVKRDRTDGQSAIQQANQIRAAYLQQMSQLKDAKTRRIALADVSRIDAKIAILKAEADKQKARQARNAAIVPTFASGGFVGSSGGGYNGRIPGMYDRADNRMIRVSGNEVVLNPKQYAPIIPYMQAIKVPGFANGGATSQSATSSASPLMPNINFYVNLDKNGLLNLSVESDSNGKREQLKSMSLDLAKLIRENGASDPVAQAVDYARGRTRI